MGNVPVFTARLVSNASFDKVYRVYVVGDQLFFIRVGGQGDFRETMLHRLGILGALVGSMMENRAEKKEKASIEAIDQTHPEHLLAAHADNFRLAAAELQDGAVDAPSFYGIHGPHVGRCVFNLRNGNRMNFQFDRTEDMRIAVDALLGLFPLGFRINVRWDETKKRYEKSEDAA